MWFNSLQSMSLLVQLIAFLSLSSWKSIGVGAFHSTFQPVRTKFGNFAKEPTLSTNSKLYMSSTSSGSQHAPKGCAATPYMKKKVIQQMRLQILIFNVQVSSTLTHNKIGCCFWSWRIYWINNIWFSAKSIEFVWNWIRRTIDTT